MRIKKILFPTDFSERNQEVLADAVSLAHDFDAELFVAHVVEPGTAYGLGDSCWVADPETDRAMYREMLAATVSADATVRLQQVLLDGLPATEILKFANLKGIDLIVMSTHGRTGLSHLVLGSVAEAVMRRAPCPVLTIRPKAVFLDQEDKPAVSTTG